MTPLQVAVETHVAFYATQPREPRSEASAKATAFAAMRASITAYLTALSEDEATVEKVAEAFFMSRSAAALYPNVTLKNLDTETRAYWDKAAIAALTALASRDERK